MATASAMIEAAACKVGLATPGNVPEQVAAFGLGALNRVYRWVWQQFPFREARIIDLAVPVAAMEATVTMPAALDAVRSVWAVDRALVPIHETTEMREGATWRTLAGPQPLRYVSLPDGADPVTGGPVRRVKLIPPPGADITLYVNGLRRFAELAAGDEPLLERTHNALFDYLVAELYEFDDQDARAVAERAKAAQELEAAVNWQEAVEDADYSATPGASFMEE